MPKTLRTAFIRVSENNNTSENGLITYTDSDIVDMIKCFEKFDGTTFWYIKHKADDFVILHHQPYVLYTKM